MTGEMEEAERIARAFHEAYERLAPSYGYETRQESAVPWVSVPLMNKRLMVAVAGEVMRAQTVALKVLRAELVVVERQRGLAFDGQVEARQLVAVLLGAAPTGESLARAEEVLSDATDSWQPSDWERAAVKLASALVSVDERFKSATAKKES